jgi:4-hydroxymandelate oxidase
MRTINPSRRQALARMAAFVAASPLLPAELRARQLDPRPLSSHVRTPGFNEMLTAFDFEPVMFSNVTQAVYDYTAHGDGSEFTLRRNREAFGWVDLVPGKAAVVPSAVDLSTTILDVPMKFPILIAPSATMVPLHPDGEAGMHKAGTSTGTLMVLSQNSSMTPSQVASAASGPMWFQFYPQEDIGASRTYIDRALTVGCKAVVVTLDQQASFYERTQQDVNLGGGLRNAPRAIGPRALAGIGRYRVSASRVWYTWDYLERLKKALPVPLLVKGIVTAEDAKLAVEHGMDGIIVSNHGGRSMDYGPSTLEVLPEIVAAVNRGVPVITDSGYRRGTDILKALALGADAVMLGRTTRWALGAFGAPGVEKLIDIMQRELVAAAASAGCATRAAIGPEVVRTKFR